MTDEKAALVGVLVEALASGGMMHGRAWFLDRLDTLFWALSSPAASNGVALIAAERQRHLSQEGWTAAHDDGHRNGELAVSAARYAVAHTGRVELKRMLARNWRWGSCWWKPRDAVRNLVRAGALIAAEIDRLQRVEEVGVSVGSSGGPRQTGGTAAR